MALHLSPSFCLFTVTIIFIIVHVPASVSATYAKYENCSAPFHCANLENVSYPFWGASRPEYCGHPGYELDCAGEFAEVTILKIDYKVLEVNYSSRTLTVAMEDYWDNICPLKLVDGSIDFSLFNYTSDTENITLYYRCPALLEDISAELLPFQFNCSSADKNPYNFFSIWDSDRVNSSMTEAICSYLSSCDTKVTISVGQTTFTAIERNPTLVNLMEALREGFGLQWFINDRLCDQCQGSGGLCGYDSDTRSFTCHCPDKPYPEHCPSKDKGEKKAKSLKAVIGVAVASGVVAIGLLCFCIFIVLRRRKSVAQYNGRYLQTLPSGTSSTSTSMSFSKSISTYPSSKSDLAKESTYFGAQVFSYAELEEATNNFDSSKELGDGGFGIVYYGVLKDGRSVAVKRLYESTVKRVEQFKNEIEILTRLRHRNLVALYGCTSRHSRELLLVYEYIPNGTVADHLHGNRSKSDSLSWSIRMNIAIETAEALAFLHASDVIHRDVKTNNILLDNRFHVKVADFGLSRFFPTNVTHVSTAPQGTPGYVDPQYYQCYQLTEKSDVYSFGVVLIELISSLEAVDTNRHRDDINLASMAINRIQNRALNELIDPYIGFEQDYAVRNMVTSVAELAFRCLQQDREDRPSMQEILQLLKEIQNQQLGAQKAEIVDFYSTDDVVLLKNVPPPLSSPDSGGNDKWMKIRTL
ncbi:LEAF RUST 10 DISEASE-RESISTANCE LOCUS RECEPTOR-LIKE PROTEIN KINASE-like 1.4 isoform X2 [Mangifera indica]|uniref:LEAF RUST 10 DISEASE-RESISTANCE LOCUS RECEPTOR-LIKE PROTEIN KINASE-like 1.4 isoform X2 n=1 Tax=Mangifera indica TaxID=29780 RepID=UPI001CFAC724|nr:LEAF RUST 10 DISEASE-RESISTANCE LOCUS RECEPTOR-LIKE PROTEIN KINASE-like 1.4 isoform X2 [Mangifera indica]XP_044505177.1 LEAF RUST 10 DISEASE-RESISTANCE LOCUS RECEPTOR-LIKE PROTEIN KINASE-like 1.4 isoform X2 [Mangifera indica]